MGFFKRESDFSKCVRLIQEREAAKLRHARRQLADERAVIKREAEKMLKDCERRRR